MSDSKSGAAVLRAERRCAAGALADALHDDEGPDPGEIETPQPSANPMTQEEVRSIRVSQASSLSKTWCGFPLKQHFLYS